MASKNTNRHKPTKIKVGNFELEILTLGNGSQIDLLKLEYVLLPKTFWIDLQLEIESTLDVKVISMAKRPLISVTLPGTYQRILHIIHTPKMDDDHDWLSHAHADIPQSREEQIVVLHKMNAPLAKA